MNWAVNYLTKMAMRKRAGPTVGPIGGASPVLGGSGVAPKPAPTPNPKPTPAPAPAMQSYVNTAQARRQGDMGSTPQPAMQSYVNTAQARRQGDQ